MTNPLTSHLMEAGLLEFGLFGKEEIPFRLNLHLLPAYPHLLKQIAESAQAHLTRLPVDRLICTPSALPFGVALSQQTNIPLVYSLGSEQPGVFDLVGAYDVGHPALLLTNIWGGRGDITALVDKARKVGLEVNSVLAIVNYGKGAHDGLNLIVLLSLPDALAQLTESGKLPHGQAHAVRDWLDRYPG